MTWPKVRLDSLCDVTSSKRIFAADYTNEGVPFYRAKEISEKHNGALSVSSELFISRRQFEKLRSKFGAPKPGDLLLTSIGALLGEPYVVKYGEEFYFKDGNLTWFKKLDGIDSYFLYYWMISPQGKGELERAKIGSAQPAFTIMLLKQMVVGLPPLPLQQRIASILSAYDALIDNNTRRIKILEEMGQMIYREWFVTFRFPGHEKVKMAESELGSIPEGWESKRLEDVAKVNDLSIKSSTTPERIRYIDIASVSTARIAKIESMNLADAPGRARRVVRHGDIIWSTVRPNRRSYALIFTPEPNLIVSTGFAVLTATIVPFSYLYLTVTTDAFGDYLTNHATGSAYPAVTGKEFQQAQLVVPPTLLMKRFHEIVEPMLSLSWCLHQRNVNLRTTRDLLLPKLISGEISVEAAVEAAAELVAEPA